MATAPFPILAILGGSRGLSPERSPALPTAFASMWSTARLFCEMKSRQRSRGQDKEKRCDAALSVVDFPVPGGPWTSVSRLPMAVSRHEIWGRLRWKRCKVSWTCSGVGTGRGR